MNKKFLNPIAKFAGIFFLTFGLSTQAYSQNLDDVIVSVEGMSIMKFDQNGIPRIGIHFDKRLDTEDFLAFIGISPKPVVKVTEHGIIHAYDAKQWNLEAYEMQMTYDFDGKLSSYRMFFNWNGLSYLELQNRIRKISINYGQPLSLVRENGKIDMPVIWLNKERQVNARLFHHKKTQMLVLELVQPGYQKEQWDTWEGKLLRDVKIRNTFY